MREAKTDRKLDFCRSQVLLFAVASAAFRRPTRVGPQRLGSSSLAFVIGVVTSGSGLGPGPSMFHVKHSISARCPKSSIPTVLTCQRFASWPEIRQCTRRHRNYTCSDLARRRRPGRVRLPWNDPLSRDQAMTWVMFHVKRQQSLAALHVHQRGRFPLQGSQSLSKSHS